MTTVQDIFDKRRNNENRIKDIKEEIQELTRELKQRKKQKKIIEKELDNACIDLIKQKKIKWIECNLNEWREYVENNENDPAIYYRYYYDGSLHQQGYYKGVFTNLNAKEYKHFMDYINDYFYYGCPNYQDYNHPNHDGSECYLAFGGGDAYIKEIEWD